MMMINKDNDKKFYHKHTKNNQFHPFTNIFLGFKVTELCYFQIKNGIQCQMIHILTVYFKFYGSM